MKTNRWMLLSMIVTMTGSTLAQQVLDITRDNNAPRAHLDVHGTPSPSLALLAAPSAPDNQDDPAYTQYKNGYNLILDEKWKEARKKLAEVVSKFPKSEYVDDAQYWSAYALKHLDYKKAVQAYEQFIESYPASKYYDDAVSDLGDLDTHVVISTGNDSSVVTIGGRGKSYAYAFGPDMRKVERDIRKAQREMFRHTGRVGRTLAPLAPLAIAGHEREELNRETQLKMDALQAIGESREDEKAFQTLREVALDRKQAWPLRETSLSMLADFKKFDILPVFLDLAKKDTNEEVQTTAIYYIGQVSKDKNKSVEILSGLFAALPSHRTNQLETIMYSVADIGNDKAVEFLTRVARTHENYDLRSDAVRCLGDIGSEKARAALFDILQGK